MTKCPQVRRVLVVENDPDRLAVLRRRFRSARLTVATGYSDAIKALRACRFDVVLLDHDLGGSRNGCDVAFWMRRLPVARRPVRVLVHSSSVRGALAIATTLKWVGVRVEVRHYEQPYEPGRKPFV